MLAADLVLVVHMGVLVYMVLGGFLALRRFALIWPHLGMAVWSVYVTLTGFTCPLTRLEKWLLEKGGAVPYEGSFIGYYLQGTFYPGQYEVVVWLCLMTVVLVSYAVVFSRRRRLAVL